jgi:hypothetical protein
MVLVPLVRMQTIPAISGISLQGQVVPRLVSRTTPMYSSVTNRLHRGGSEGMNEVTEGTSH